MPCLVSRAAFIKNKRARKKSEVSYTCFFSKLVFGDLKSHPDGYRRFPPPSPILLIPFSSKIDPLGIKCLTFLRHASNSGFTVAWGQHGIWMPSNAFRCAKRWWQGVCRMSVMAPRQGYGGAALPGQRRRCINGAQVAVHRRWRGVGGAFRCADC